MDFQRGAFHRRAALPFPCDMAAPVLPSIRAIIIGDYTQAFRKGIVIF